MPADIPKKYNEVLKISEKANKALKCKGIVSVILDLIIINFSFRGKYAAWYDKFISCAEIANYCKISFVKLVKWMVMDASINR